MEWGLSDGGDRIFVRAVVRDQEVTEKGVEDLKESSKSIYIMRSRIVVCRLTGSIKDSASPTDRSDPCLPVPLWKVHGEDLVWVVGNYEVPRDCSPANLFAAKARMTRSYRP